MFDKGGLGFNVSQNQKIYENFFIPQKEKMKCSFCDKDRHLESFCFLKKGTLKDKPEHSLLKIPEHPRQYPEHSFFNKKKECSYCKRMGHLEINGFLKIKHLEIK